MKASSFLKRNFCLSTFALIANFILIPNSSFASDADTMNSPQTVALTAKEETKVEEAFLDKLWENRQSSTGKSEIVNFLKNQPVLPENFNINWKVARLVYFNANFILPEQTTKDEKLSLLQYGYNLGIKAKELNPSRVEGFYWYAINLGSYGLEKGIFTALKNAKPGRDALLEAAKIDAKYHWCGPLRILGRYYQEVPGGLISFGDKKIANEYFLKAIETCPNFRVNTMYLGILKKKQGLNSEALDFFKKAQSLPNLDGKIEESRYSKELAENIKTVQNM
ncbi:hypothetical protein [Spirobacillus cienkowskii]|uniref:hypothetical protein n=1 Tax=Spirobacillus cienkowskii TaxID=495820 RepID=UPI0030D62394